MPDAHTAILIFTRSEAEEARVKAVDCPRLFRAMNQRVRRLARRTGYPVVVVEGRDQVGHTFGQRLTHAFRKVFGQGYERVIALGNDCLDLRLTDLQEALTALDTQPAVLGPDLDGGVYLIGLHRQMFRPEAFEALPWQQAGLWSALGQYCGTVHRLRAKRDADDERALRTAIRYCRDLRFRRLLARLLDAGHKVPPPRTPFPTARTWSGHLFFRGPPLRWA